MKQIGTSLLTVFLTAAGFLGFVAVIGGVTVWFRFFTAELPSVQAIDAMPRSELLVKTSAAGRVGYSSDGNRLGFSPEAGGTSASRSTRRRAEER